MKSKKEMASSLISNCNNSIINYSKRFDESLRQNLISYIQGDVNIVLEEAIITKCMRLLHKNVLKDILEFPRIVVKISSKKSHKNKSPKKQCTLSYKKQYYDSNKEGNTLFQSDFSNVDVYTECSVTKIEDNSFHWRLANQVSDKMLRKTASNIIDISIILLSVEVNQENSIQRKTFFRTKPSKTVRMTNRQSRFTALKRMFSFLLRSKDKNEKQCINDKQKDDSISSQNTLRLLESNEQQGLHSLSDATKQDDLQVFDVDQDRISLLNKIKSGSIHAISMIETSYIDELINICINNLIECSENNTISSESRLDLTLSTETHDLKNITNSELIIDNKIFKKPKKKKKNIFRIKSAFNLKSNEKHITQLEHAPLTNVDSSIIDKELTLDLVSSYSPKLTLHEGTPIDSLAHNSKIKPQTKNLTYGTSCNIESTKESLLTLPIKENQSVQGSTHPALESVTETLIHMNGDTSEYKFHSSKKSKHIKHIFKNNMHVTLHKIREITMDDVLVHCVSNVLELLKKPKVFRWPTRFDTEDIPEPMPQKVDRHIWASNPRGDGCPFRLSVWSPNYCPEHGWKKRILGGGFLHRSSFCKHHNAVGKSTIKIHNKYGEGEENIGDVTFEDEKDCLSVILE